MQEEKINFDDSFNFFTCIVGATRWIVVLRLLPTFRSTIILKSLFRNLNVPLAGPPVLLSLTPLDNEHSDNSKKKEIINRLLNTLNNSINKKRKLKIHFLPSSSLALSLGSSTKMVSERGIFPISGTRFNRPWSSDCRVVRIKWFENKKHCLSTSFSLLLPKVELNRLLAPLGFSRIWTSVPGIQRNKIKNTRQSRLLAYIHTYKIFIHAFAEHVGSSINLLNYMRYRKKKNEKSDALFWPRVYF